MSVWYRPWSKKKRVQTESLDLDFRCEQTHKPVHMCVEHKF